MPGPYVREGQEQNLSVCLSSSLDQQAMHGLVKHSLGFRMHPCHHTGSSPEDPFQPLNVPLHPEPSYLGHTPTAAETELSSLPACCA